MQESIESRSLEMDWVCWADEEATRRARVRMVLENEGSILYVDEYFDEKREREREGRNGCGEKERMAYPFYTLTDAWQR
jgi:hypothetical protein